MRDVLFKRRDATKERIDWQLEAERKGVFTLNEEDLYSYKKQFVSACTKNIPSSLSVDVTDPAVDIMGAVRGYFHGKWVCPLLGALIDSHHSLAQTLP